MRYSWESVRGARGNREPNEESVIFGDGIDTSFAAGVYLTK